MQKLIKLSAPRTHWGFAHYTEFTDCIFCRDAKGGGTAAPAPHYPTMNPAERPPLPPLVIEVGDGRRCRLA